MLKDPVKFWKYVNGKRKATSTSDVKFFKDGTLTTFETISRGLKLKSSLFILELGLDRGSFLDGVDSTYF